MEMILNKTGPSALEEELIKDFRSASATLSLPVFRPELKLTKSVFFDSIPADFSGSTSAFVSIHNTIFTSFDIFIDKRIVYLESLKDLPDDWIDGVSSRPSTETIQNSVSILRDIQRYTKSFEKYKDLEIVMSPTPSGSISFQLCYNSDYFLLTILNNIVEFELCKDDHLSDIDPITILDTEKVFSKLDIFFYGQR